MGLLLGSKRGRSYGGKALKYGSVAALGALAFKAYSDWQAQQAAQGRTPAAGGPGAPVPAYAPPAALPAPQAEAHSQRLLKAMIAAAKSDGHLDERERGLIDAELQRTGASAADRQWVEAELRRPVEPADVAAGVPDLEAAGEVYLASLLVVDTTTTMERAYLDALAQQLQLPAGLKAELEARAAAV